MATYVDGTYISGGATVGADPVSGGTDVSSVVNEDAIGGDTNVFCAVTNEAGQIGPVQMDGYRWRTLSAHPFQNPWVATSAWLLGDFEDASNPHTYARMWISDNTYNTQKIRDSSGLSDGDALAMFTMEQLTDASSQQNFTQASVERTYIFEWGTPTINFDWVRDLENKSLTGTNVIDSASYTWNTPMKWAGPISADGADPKVTQIASFAFTVAGATSLNMKIIWADPADLPVWTASATYGFTPAGGTKEMSPTSAQWWNGNTYTDSSADQLKQVDLVTGAGSSTRSIFSPVSGPVSGSYDLRPFALLVEDNTGAKSYWAVSQSPYLSGAGNWDSSAGTDAGGNKIEDAPGLDSDGSSYPDGDYPDLNPGDTPTAAGHKPYINVDDPEAPYVGIKDPTGSPVDRPPGTGSLPPGTAGDAPLTLVNSGRLLYVYYGGNIITTYVIPQAVWDGLATSVKQYVGYTDAAGAEIVGPATITVTVLIGYVFQAGTYRASMGNKPYLWVWAQNHYNKDFLVTSGVMVVTEAPTQDEIDAADKHIAGGRDPSQYPTLTYSEAVQAAGKFDASIVVPVAP